MPNPASLLIKPDDLQSLRNETTQAQSLYVMQNQFGAIKIGRSAQPESRLVQVAQKFRCQVKMVAVFPQNGHKEEWCHVHLAKQSLGAEWFNGIDSTKVRISELLEVPLTWPYTLDAAGLKRWLSRVTDEAADRYWRKRERTVIRRLLGAIQGATRVREDLDGDIALLVGYTDLCTADVESGYIARKDGQGPMVPVPAFTRTLAAAKLLWPDEVPQADPITLSPLQYCLDALCVAWGFDPSRLRPLNTR
ncbi:hypothetical protein [Rhodoferax sp. GW822-FHT02A01]|uniref:hypothetical protein n=1 Tax=Rhodoferax sp. GW822-FHT02A01 TaxID=3141537 RepID=UPI00315D4172